MGRRIYLVQHGESYPENVDPERKLTPKGIEETKTVAKYLSKLGIKLNAILHSTKLRSKQTANIFSSELNVSNVFEVNNLEPLSDPKNTIQIIEKYEGDIMLVGHLPNLSKLVELLTGSESVLFRYSGVLCLEEIEKDKWKIKWFIIPEIVPSA
jgi:phosphohistidine phosphatase